MYRVLLRQCAKAVVAFAVLVPDISAAADQAAELESLAVNVDKTIQTCGLHAAAFERTKGSILSNRGFALTDQAPEAIKGLSSPSTFGTSKFLHWPDPHADIWLIASSEKPACRVVVSSSEWADQIGPRLSELVQVGNYWRLAQPGENGLAGGEDAISSRSVYFMDTPDEAKVRPTLLIMAAKPGQSVRGQKMIITVLMINKVQG